MSDIDKLPTPFPLLALSIESEPATIDASKNETFTACRSLSATFA
jgi:hypothetical protein